MKSSIALILIAAGALSACSRPVVKEKETIIERPVVVAPAPAAAGGATTASCQFQAQTYTHSARSCQQGAEWVCNNGAWQRTNNSC